MSQHPHTDGSAPDLAASVAIARGGARADEFLDEHTRLARLQRQQIEEENTTRRRLLKLEHASALFKLALEVTVATIVTVILIALGAAMWNAANDNSLVVESFSVPPDLAARGLSGEVVAAKLLDKLSQLQQQTQSNRTPTSYANNSGGDIKLQIPETGVSIGEFNRSLHSWLGNQTRITGEVYRASAGIVLTARVGTGSGPAFAGTEADFDTLIQKAAESVYRATQPYRYAVYLANAGRTQEAEAQYEDLIANGSPQDRAWALVGIYNLYLNRGETARGLKALHQALAIRPDFIMAHFNLAGLHSQLQHDEEALASQRKVVELLHSRKDNDVLPQSTIMGFPANEAALAGELGDYQGQIRLNAELEAEPGDPGPIENARQNDAIAYAFLHDGAGSRAAFANLPPTKVPLTLIARAGNRAFCEVLLGRPDALIGMYARFEAQLTKAGPGARDAIARQLRPATAFALALEGRFAEAHATIDKTPTDCVICLRVRGRIDMLQKNWAGAEYWFSRARAAAPTPPFAYADWGQMKLRKGDAEGAIALFRQAAERSPRYADPLEMWGEALMMQNRSDLALAKFSQANERAPNWGRLHMKWGAALLYLGRKDEAKRELDRAARLDLRAEERAELAALRRR